VVTLEGDAWRRHRLMVNSAFSDANLRVVAAATIDKVRSMYETWDNLAAPAPPGPRRDTADLQRLLSETQTQTQAQPASVLMDEATLDLALAVIARAGFGMDFAADDKHIRLPSGRTRQLNFFQLMQVRTLPQSYDDQSTGNTFLHAVLTWTVRRSSFDSVWVLFERF
jgi:cytochrome P450